MSEYIRKAQYHETDKMGIIHHANYVKWMEEARIAYLDRIGISYASMEKEGVFSPVSSISLEYLKPVEFGDEVGITVKVTRYSGVVLELEYEFCNRATGEVCTRAVSKHCFLSGGRIVPLKRVLPSAHEALLKEKEKEN